MAKQDTAPKDAGKDDVLNPTNAAKKLTEKKKKAKEEQEELSEEDQQLVAELEMIVERLKEESPQIHRAALESLNNVIRSTTSSMTSVPKPLKYLKAHYAALAELYPQWEDAANKKALASILSLLGMAYDKDKRRDCLKYRLLAGYADGAVSEWGHEYVRHLAMEVGTEYSAREAAEESNDDVVAVGLEAVAFFFSHNAEVDAVDLLEELDRHELVTDYVTKETFERVCVYMVSCSALLGPPADRAYLETARKIYGRFGTVAQCLGLSLRLGRPELVREDWERCTTQAERAQLALMMARQQVHMPELAGDDDAVLGCMNNAGLSEQYLRVARALELLEPKSPEDIYKTHLQGGTETGLDSARHNLASTFVNAFVNAGYGTDTLMTGSGEWVFKNKDLGMLSAAASVGMVMLWDVDQGLDRIDRYLESGEDAIKAGALLAIGMVTASVHDETDAAKALLSDYVADEGRAAIIKLAALCGLGLAYAGTRREDVTNMLIAVVGDADVTVDLAAVAALSAGLVCVGSANGDVATTIIQAMLERADSELSHKYARFLALGLALLFVGTRDAADAVRETLRAITHPLGAQAAVLVQVCAYAGSGNVLEVQRLLHICAEPETVPLAQAFAALGVGVVAMGEQTGAEMALRTFDHLMHYGATPVRRAVPLAIALVCASDPQPQVVDTLNRHSHDTDKAVAASAAFAMGIVGAGSNNARLAQLLRALAAFHARDPDVLFVVRVAQGLLHMGKGALTLNPFHHGRSLLSPTALAGLLVPLVAMTSAEKLVMADSHFLLFYLVRAMYPRFLVTLDADLQPVAAAVRVGQTVDAVGQVGRPKTITGFQTHDTPVLLGHSERAELATDRYKSLADVLEGIVILEKNPDYIETDEDA
ncbi:proteasome regulatory particle base subunit [Coemansia sp. RSA 552]|nr:proteasome regulatory particle base subunit [Coemansia sp. RSA 552]